MLRAQQFCDENDLAPEYYATNDMIAQFPGLNVVAVTLHPDKMDAWLAQRRNNKRQMPSQVWSHDGGDRNNSLVTNRLKDWGGSVGMFAYAVARERGHNKVILCGVPMTADNHFVRRASWTAVGAFVRAWDQRRAEMLPHCRSLSGGITGDMFGEPTLEWLNSKEEIAA
jgi:hypothetical protein